METKHGTCLIHPAANELAQLRESAPARPEPLTIVIFGASGDLAKRKLIPALYHLQHDGYLPEHFAVVGFSRSPMSDAVYRDNMAQSIRETLGPELKEDLAANPLIRSLYYLAGDNDDKTSFVKLKQKLEELDKKHNLPGNRLYYLAVAPSFFPVIIKQLGGAGLIQSRHAPQWSRIVIEKPFGRDLKSAYALNREITTVLDESQIYRIDHYLGKETVQNILSLRFGNAIFEPLFNQKYVDHVQITVSETLGMEGKRGAYYDTAGATRDMFENHMLQLLTLVAMEPPPLLEASSMRDAKVMLLRALVPMNSAEAAHATVRGQYGPGMKDGKPLPGYHQEENVSPQSTTETYVAMRLQIDNWRWAGVPFYLRTGKRLPRRASEIVITFKEAPTQLFRQSGSDYCLNAQRPQPNQLILYIQPDEGISMSVNCKQPGMCMQLDEVDMSFLYKQAFKQRSPEAYERLLLDALKGDASLFTRSDEVYQAWTFVSSVLEAWSHLPPPNFPNYAPSSQGPAEADKLFRSGHGGWRTL